MRSVVFAAVIGGLLVIPAAVRADEPDCQFLEFVRRQAAALRAGDGPPKTLPDWQRQRVELRRRMQQAWGPFPEVACPLEPRIVGTLRRDGYRVEKLLLQTRPGIWMTANAYVPDRPGKLPAILCVHGHWHNAKQEPTVQARCIGAARLGFFVLAVDAFGAGERAVGKALGEYHGEMVAATLLPVGLPLSGLQVYENMRAVDYLLTRPEVDGRRLAITGASGGGNQTMYAGAWDERFAAVVPVCSVGNYQAFLGAACCMCEVVPGALQFTEEWGVLAMVAPRALMVVNGTRDAVQFSVTEAAKSVNAARAVFALYDQPERLRHAVFDWRHDYSGPMREAMYGWVTQQVLGQGDGGPIAEPPLDAEEPDTLRCFPGETRPDDFVTLPRFAAAEAGKLLAGRPSPGDRKHWASQREALRVGLAKCLAVDAAAAAAATSVVSKDETADARSIAFQPEPGLSLLARQLPAAAPPDRLAIVLDLDGAEHAAQSDLAAALRGDGWSLLTVDLRATGKLAYAKDHIGRAPDHTTAEWSLWLGRPLLGQWVVDVRRLLDALEQADGRLPEQVLVCGLGPAGLVAVCAAALEPRITQVAAVGTLASYVSDVPYEGQRLGLMVPGILRDAGDVPQLAALVAPRPLVIAGGVTGGGDALDDLALRAAYAFAREAYAAGMAAEALHVHAAADPADIATELRPAAEKAEPSRDEMIRAVAADFGISPEAVQQEPWRQILDQDNWYHHCRVLDWPAIPAAATKTVAPAGGRGDYVCPGADDDLVIQKALDALPAGGGKLVLLPGTFVLGNCIRPRDNTEIEIQGTLQVGDAVTSPLTADVLPGQTTVQAADASRFRPGQWVTLMDEEPHKNFHAGRKYGEGVMIQAIHGNTLTLSDPLAVRYAASRSFSIDGYLVAKQAYVTTSYSAILVLERRRVYLHGSGRSGDIDGNKARQSLTSPVMCSRAIEDLRQNCGISVVDSAGVKIEGLRVHEANLHNVALYNSHDCEVTSLEARQSNDKNLCVIEVARVRVMNNECHDSLVEDGICCHGPVGPYMLVARNHSTGNPRYGVHLGICSDYAVIARNAVADNHHNLCVLGIPPYDKPKNGKPQENKGLILIENDVGPARAKGAK